MISFFLNFESILIKMILWIIEASVMNSSVLKHKTFNVPGAAESSVHL